MFQNFLKPIHETLNRNIHLSSDELTRSFVIGSIVAMTPTFGIQMPIVTGLWLICRNFKKLHFNLHIGLTLTWITNYLTFLPYYYISYNIGAFILKFADNESASFSYNDFASLWEPVVNSGKLIPAEEIGAIFLNIGVSLLIGTLPFIIIAGSLSYWFVKKYLQQRHLSSN